MTHATNHHQVHADVFLVTPDQPVGPGAHTLYRRAFCFAKQHGGKGFLSRRQLQEIGHSLVDLETCISELVDAFLWLEADGGYWIAGWDALDQDTHSDTKSAAGPRGPRRAA